MMNRVNGRSSLIVLDNVEYSSYLITLKVIKEQLIIQYISIFFPIMKSGKTQLIKRGET